MADSLADLDTSSRVSDSGETPNSPDVIDDPDEDVSDIDDTRNKEGDEFDPDAVREEADRNTQESPYESGEEDDPSNSENGEEEDKGSEEDNEEQPEGKEGDEEDREDDEGKEEEEDATITDLLKKSFGYESLEENEYEDSMDGVLRLAQDAAKEGMNQQIQSYKENNPEAGQFLEYLENDGDPSKYIETVSPQDNYLEIEEIPEENVTMQKKLVRDKLEQDGYDEDQIENQLDTFETNNLLHNQAEMALHSLKKRQSERKSQLLEEQKREAEAARKEQKEYIDTQRNIIDENSEIAGMPMPQSRKDEFKQFITPDEETGVSPYAQAVQNLEPEQVLGIQYLVMHDFDLSSLVDNRAATKNAEGLTQQLKKQDKSVSDEANQHERGRRQVDSTKDLAT